MAKRNQSRPRSSRALVNIAVAEAAIFFAFVSYLLGFVPMEFDQQILLVAFATMVVAFVAMLASMAVFVDARP